MIALRDAGIRAKLTAGLGLALVLIVLVGAAGLYNLQALSRSAGQIVTIWQPRVELLGEIKAEMAEYGMLARSRLNEETVGPGVHVSDRIRSIAQTLDRDWRLYETIPGDAEERLLYSVLRNVWSEYEAALADTEDRVPGPARPCPAERRRGRRISRSSITPCAGSTVSSSIPASEAAKARRQVDRTFMMAFWLTVAAIVIASVRRLCRHLLGRAATSARRSASERGHAPAERTAMRRRS